MKTITNITLDEHTPFSRPMVSDQGLVKDVTKGKGGEEPESDSGVLIWTNGVTSSIEPRHRDGD